MLSAIAARCDNCRSGEQKPRKIAHFQVINNKLGSKKKEVIINDFVIKGGGSRVPIRYFQIIFLSHAEPIIRGIKSDIFDRDKV